MFKKVLAVISSTLVGSILFAKVKEQRSYRSFVQEKMMRLNGMKSTFDSVEGAKKHLKRPKMKLRVSMQVLNMNLTITLVSKITLVH